MAAVERSYLNEARAHSGKIGQIGLADQLWPILDFPRNGEAPPRQGDVYNTARVYFAPV